MSRSCYLLAVLLASICTIGCGKSTELPPREDTSFVGEVVSNVSDARNDPEKLAQLFAPDALPDEAWLKSAADKSFLVGEIEINGDEATVAVEWENHFADPLGTTTWKCKRDGESWKITSAPLAE